METGDCFAFLSPQTDSFSPIGRIISIQVGKPQTIGSSEAKDRMDTPWTTGFFKEPVRGPIRVGRCNLDGDGQADLVNHGGPEKAVNVYPLEHYSFWEQTFGLTNLPYGAFGENFTIVGCLEESVCIGDIFRVGEVVLQISQPRQPCWKLSRRWRIRDFALKVQESGRTGWYFRVLQEGMIEAGASLVLTERPYPQWTVQAANRVMHSHTSDPHVTRALLNCHLLSERWRETLRKRLLDGTTGSGTARLFGPN